MFVLFFFNDTATTEIYTLSLHDALPISLPSLHIPLCQRLSRPSDEVSVPLPMHLYAVAKYVPLHCRSEEHTSELQSRQYIVCRLLLEKKNIHSIFSSCVYKYKNKLKKPT